MSDRTDFSHMPGREVLRRLERALRSLPVGKVGGIPRVTLARALRDLERSMQDEADEVWTPFERGTMTDQSDDSGYVEAMAKASGHSERAIRATLRSIAEDDYWRNNLYQVSIRRIKHEEEGVPDLLHLSIKRTDQRVIRDWRHLQRIKNELVGPRHEAVELYPSEDRLVDTANQYHLWCVDDPEARWPVGFDQGRLVLNVDGGTGTVNRRREE